MNTYAQDSRPVWEAKPVSGPQLQLISDMAKERGLDIRETFPQRPKTMSEAKAIINWLKAQPVASHPTSPQGKAAIVPEGYYAIQMDGKPHFFRVRHGRKPGIVFVAEQASDQFYPVASGARRGQILGLIGKDLAAAGLAYSQEMGRCYRCSRVLTDHNNPYFHLGLGPDCGQK